MPRKKGKGITLTDYYSAQVINMLRGKDYQYWQCDYGYKTLVPSRDEAQKSLYCYCCEKTNCAGPQV